MARAPLPPSPPGSLLLGHLGELQRDMLGFAQRCARELGDVVAWRMAHRRVYLISHPDLIEDILVTNNRNYIKDFSLRLYRPLIGNGLLTSEGDFWLRQRRLIQPAFLKPRLAAYGEVMAGFTQRMLTHWHDGLTLDIHEQMMELALHIAAKTLFDADIAANAHEVGEALEAALRSIDTRLLFHPPLWVPTPSNLRLKRAVARLDRIVYQMIEQRRASGKDHGDFLSILLHARDEDDGSRMTDQQLRDEAMTLFLAGHETTALALSWTMYLLAQHPDVTARLVQELDTVLGGRLPTAADVPRLRVTEQIVMEAMRLYPPAYGLARENLATCEIGGFHVPKGTTLYFLQWVVHRDPRFFDRPEAFLPERWTPAFQQRLPKYAYFPFGGGPRLCIGNSFAMMEAILILGTLFQQFRVELVPNQEIKIWPSITLRPKHGIKVVIRQRTAAAPPHASQAALAGASS